MTARKDNPAKRGRKKQWILSNEIIEEVKILSGRGLTQRQIFHYYGISRDCWYDTIKTSPQLLRAVRMGKAKSISFASGKLMDKVKEGNLSAIMFFLRTQAGFCEKSSLKIEGNKKTPAMFNLNVTDPIEAARIYQQLMG